VDDVYGGGRGVYYGLGGVLFFGTEFGWVGLGCNGKEMWNGVCPCHE